MKTRACGEQKIQHAELYETYAQCIERDETDVYAKSYDGLIYVSVEF